MYKVKEKTHDFEDPFNAGQMVGVITTLILIEKDGGISEEELLAAKHTCADRLVDYFDRPAEDILLMLDKSLKDRKKI